MAVCGLSVISMCWIRFTVLLLFMLFSSTLMRMKFSSDYLSLAQTSLCCNFWKDFLNWLHDCFETWKSCWLFDHHPHPVYKTEVWSSVLKPHVNSVNNQVDNYFLRIINGLNIWLIGIECVTYFSAKTLFRCTNKSCKLMLIIFCTGFLQGNTCSGFWWKRNCVAASSSDQFFDKHQKLSC